MSKDSAAASIGVLIMDFINAIRDDNLEWKEKTQDKINLLREKSELDLEGISQKIQMGKLKFEQDVQIVQRQFKSDMDNLERRINSDAKRYENFLFSIEELGDKLEQFYPTMPQAMVLVIHDHATQLLHQAWESSDVKEKFAFKKELVQFLALIFDDINPAVLQGETSNLSSTLPHKTLNHIKDRNK